MIIEKAKSEYCAYRIPGLVMVENDALHSTLLGCYECRKSSGSDWGEIDLKIIRSTDSGENWETVEVVHGNGDTLNNPVMVYCGKTLHFLYCRNYKRLYHRVSDDGGSSFSEPADITEVFESGGFFYNAAAIGPGHGIVKSGTIIIPVWFADNREDTKAHRPSFVRTIYSCDGGRSWKLGERVDDDRQGECLINPSECALAEWNGEVIVSIRNENPERARCFAFSNSGTEGWKNHVFAPAFPDPICQGSMCVRGSTLFHINCASQSQRENLTLNIVEKGSNSRMEILVDKRGGYSDIAADDEFVYVLYERDVLEDGLYFTKIKY